MNKFKNIDAYRLVTYYCRRCNKTEYVWNSNDMVIPNQIQCIECDYPTPKVTRHRGKYLGPQIQELTPLGIRWFVTESKELYIKRIKQQIADMGNELFQDTTREIVEASLISAYLPGTVHLVDPLTLNFEEQIEVLLHTK